MSSPCNPSIAAKKKKKKESSGLKMEENRKEKDFGSRFSGMFSISACGTLQHLKGSSQTLACLNI